MTEITNKHLFITMLIIGAITIGLLIPRRNTTSYSYNTNSLTGQALQANSYASYPYGTSGASLIGSPNRGVYVPIINTNYPITEYHFGTTSTSYTPQTTQTTYYTTQQPSTDTYYYTSGDQGYVPAGCESGTDYSLTTGEPCG